MKWIPKIMKNSNFRNLHSIWIYVGEYWKNKKEISHIIIQFMEALKVKIDDIILLQMISIENDAEFVRTVCSAFHKSTKKMYDYWLVSLFVLLCLLCKCVRVRMCVCEFVSVCGCANICVCICECVRVCEYMCVYLWVCVGGCLFLNIEIRSFSSERVQKL